VSLVVYHLNDSRSHRVIWLLEELSLEYEIFRYEKTRARFAPAALEAAHPLGKTPILEFDGQRIIESGAIVDLLIRRRGAGRLAPPGDSPEYDAYQQWLHYAEASAMACLTHLNWLRLLRVTDGPGRRRLEAETARHLAFVDAALTHRDWLLGQEFTGADVQLSYFGEVCAFAGRLGPYPALQDWVRRFQARPAYAAAIRAGGPYKYAAAAAAKAAP